MSPGRDDSFFARRISPLEEMSAAARLRIGTMRLDPDALQVQHDLDDILANMVDRCELVPDAFDAQPADCRTGQRAKQNAAKRISQRGAIPRLERLDFIAARNCSPDSIVSMVNGCMADKRPRLL